MKKNRPADALALSRRGLFKTGAGLALGGMLGSSDLVRAAAAKSEKPSIYESIGVRPVINAQGTMTYLGGSLMPPEVIAAWNEAAKHFVNIPDLVDKVGERIAQLIGVEAALVTTGASGALFLGTVAAVLRDNKGARARLPNTTGIRHEVIIQSSHHSGWDAQLRPVGIKFVDVNTAEDVDKAVNEKTAMMFFMNVADPQGKIKRQQWGELAKKHKVPALMDMAADVPPREHLTGYLKMGFSMVAVSGGKAIRGPNNTGLLLGRKDLIEIAKANTSPHEGFVGRMLKVSKEEMMACLAAVDRYVHIDPKEEEREWQARISLIENKVKEIPTVKGSQSKPLIANHVPHLNLSWDPKKVKITGGEVTAQLLAGDPPIILGGGGGGGGGRRRGAGVASTPTERIGLSVFMLKDGEDQIIADRLYAILKKAAT